MAFAISSVHPLCGATDGEPFPWNDEERRHFRARLDALFFLLYGMEEPDADYILSTFPIVRDQDEAAHGRYLAAI